MVRLFHISQLFVVAFGISLMVSPQSGLANQSGGAAASASVLVSLEIPEVFKIKKFGDLNFGKYTGSGPLEAVTEFCLQTNGDGAFNVTINDTKEELFQLANKEGGAIPFNVFWLMSRGGHDAVPVNNRTPLASEIGDKCDDGHGNVGIKVSVPEDHLKLAGKGYYQSNLEIIIEPN